MRRQPRSGKSRQRNEREGPHAALADRGQIPVLSARRRWIFRLVALVCVPLVLLGGLEMILRLSGYGYRTNFFNTIRIGQQEFLVDNESFALRFFPPN